jgi:hypothetical protein
MRIFRRRITSLVVAMSLSGVLVAAGPAPAVIAGGGDRTYPSQICLESNGLQGCVDSANAGSTIHIATNTFINESVDVDKSLTLDAAPGFQPSVAEILVDDPVAPAEVHVTIDGLRLGSVNADFRADNGRSFTLLDSAVINTSSFGYAVQLYSQVPADFTVSGNRLRSQGDETYTLSLITDLAAGPVTLSAVANRLDQKETNGGGAGVGMQLRGTGEIDVDLMNNAIWDVAGAGSGDAAAIAISADGTLDLDANIVGNTLELSNGSGMDLRNDLDVGGSFAVDLFDNIISHHDFAGITLSRDPGSPQFVWRAGYNDLFANGQNQIGNRSLGPGAMFVNPRFVDRAAGNLQLRSTSPLIDEGQVCTPGGIANPDAAGRHRLLGPTVDIGAYERGAPVAEGIVHVGDDTAESIPGTEGRDILCGYGARDVMRGHAAGDYIDGGTGPDVIFGDSGADRMFGRSGGDLMCARDGNGNDLVNGGDGTDSFRTDAGDTRISLETRHSCLP